MTDSTLQDLFDRDPLSLTAADLDSIIAEMRSARAQWAQAEAAGKTRAPSATRPKVDPSTITLDGLNLKI